MRLSFEKAANTFEEALTPNNACPVASHESLVQGYLLTCRSEGKAAKTIALYSTVLRNFLWYCRQNGSLSQAQGNTATQLRQFLWYVASEPKRWGSENPACKRPASATTVGVYYRALHSFFNWCQSEELIDTNPFDHLKPPKKQNRLIRALSGDDMEQLMKACSGKATLDVRNRAILSVFLDTGLRVSELASLKLTDLDPNTGAIVVKNGKGNKERIVRVGVKAQKALWKYVAAYRRSNGDSLFLDRSANPLTTRAIKIMVKRLGQQAGIRVHPHQLRHTFAINFLRAGGDVFSLRYLLGHSSLAMTQRYLESLNADDAIRAHTRCSPLDSLAVR